MTPTELRDPSIDPLDDDLFDFGTEAHRKNPETITSNHHANASDYNEERQLNIFEVYAERVVANQRRKTIASLLFGDSSAYWLRIFGEISHQITDDSEFCQTDSNSWKSLSSVGFQYWSYVLYCNRLVFAFRLVKTVFFSQFVSCRNWRC